MEINNNVLAVWNKLVNFDLFVVFHEHAEEILVSMDEK
jgi:hypothetical protein